MRPDLNTDIVRPVPPPLIRLLLLALAAAVLLAACGGSGPGSDGGGQLRVIATTTQTADFARAVGGERAAVTQLLQPNSDPHDYEPRPDDVQETAEAQVVLRSGGGLDDWMTGLVEDSGGDARVVNLSRSLPVARPNNPHWWHDPRNTQAAVTQIRDAFIAADDQGAATYRRNADAYLTRLRALDRGIERCFASVPPRQRKLVTDHDAFGYFTARYDIDVVGAVIPGQTTQSQPNARDIARLADLIKREKVKAIFPQASLNAKASEALARQTGVTTRYELYGDTLGEKGSPGATYLTMEQANADAMIKGFTGGRRGCRIAGL